MRAVTGLRYPELARCVENSLKNKGFVYLKNKSSRITEFEIRSPCHFRVLLEDCTGERLSFFFRAPRNESSIEVRRDLEAPETESAVGQHVSIFLVDLMTLLPRKPWHGLGFFRSRFEKAKWEELGKL
jgi:hypothetical protein